MVNSQEAELAGLTQAAELVSRRVENTETGTWKQWARCIKGVWFTDEAGQDHFVQPGEKALPDWELREIEFHPMPECLPSSNLMRALRRETVTAGIPKQYQAFEFKGHRFESAPFLADVLINRKCDHDEISLALDDWQTRALQALGKSESADCAPSECVEVEIQETADGLTASKATAFSVTGAPLGEVAAGDSERDQSAKRLLAMATGNQGAFSLEEAIEAMGEFPIERHVGGAEKALARKDQENRARMVIKRLNYLLATALRWETSGQSKRNAFSANGSGVWSTNLKFQIAGAGCSAEPVPV